MGASSWSDDHYAAAATARKLRSGRTAFEYDHAVRSGAVKKATHNKLSPFGIKCRESRDSDDHPTSNGISVWFDHTGSMGEIPRVLQRKLPKLMGTLLRKGCIDDPQIQMNAIGDALSDTCPVQIGQFESGIEMDEDLNNMYLEGNGGGHGQESYELALYFMARHTELDCFQKRGKRGYLFLIGDERARDVDATVVKEIFGDTIQDIPLADIVAEVTKMYDTYFIIPTNASGGRDTSLQEYWTKLFRQKVLKLDDENLVCELIAGTIALSEGAVDSFDDLSDDLDLSDADRKIVSKALSTVTSGGKVSNVTGGELATSAVADDNIEEV